MNINIKNQKCYGDLMISFQWKDYLKGKIKSKIDQNRHIFKENFYCLIEMEKQIIFAFEVK
jgi:hypothetical protein